MDARFVGIDVSKDRLDVHVTGHCEERSDEAIQRARSAPLKKLLLAGAPAGARWIASLRSQ